MFGNWFNCLNAILCWARILLSLPMSPLARNMVILVSLVIFFQFLLFRTLISFLNVRDFMS